MSEIYVFLLDNFNNTIEEINILKPNTFKELIAQIKVSMKNIPEFYVLFILDKDNKEKIINDNENFKIVEDTLFIREADENLFNQSLFELNYYNLSESKQDLLYEKYNCILCYDIIKNEKPYLCYKCQKIFHEKCLKKWDNDCKSRNKTLTCPNCRNELPIEKWNKKLDYEESRKDNGDLLNKINEYKLDNNMHNNINKIKDKKIKELKSNRIRQNEALKKYEECIEKSIEIFKNILNQINSIYSILKIENNNSNKLNYLINIFQLNFQNIYLEELSKEINEKLNELKNYIINNDKVNKKENIFKIVHNKEIKIISSKKNINSLNNQDKIDNLENKDNAKLIQINKNIELIEHKNIINLKYYVKYKGMYDIFGPVFVKNNLDKIDLILKNTSIKSIKLVSNFLLNKGENIITIKINNKLTNLSNMFYDCYSLKDISDLKYLDVSEVANFNKMFYGCSLLSDIIPLEKWNVSNCKDFSYMFYWCRELTNIKPLENWNVSNAIDFSYMFYGCKLLSDLKPIEKWNVSNANNFKSMFWECNISDINALKYWRISENIKYEKMFEG